MMKRLTQTSWISLLSKNLAHAAQDIFCKRLTITVLLLTMVLPPVVWAKKKHAHPFDFFNHEMHTGMFEGVVTCELCHADPESYADRSRINRLGCHQCHNNPKDPPIPAEKPCAVCHKDDWFPKPKSHKTNWKAKHQLFAKQNPDECAQCHRNKKFCLDCHAKRETVVKKMHSRNFRFFHSIEARANPRKCDTCHVVSYCQTCHSGLGSSGL